jgi:hypothetical protein
MYDEEIHQKFMRIAEYLDEQTKRLWCANEALSLGWGGITAVSRATGLSRTTITTGIQELIGEKELPPAAIRRQGGGRKKNDT